MYSLNRKIQTSNETDGAAAPVITFPDDYPNSVRHFLLIGFLVRICQIRVTDINLQVMTFWRSLGRAGTVPRVGSWQLVSN